MHVALYMQTRVLKDGAPIGIFAPILKDEGLVRLLVSKCKLVTFQPGACIVRQHDKTDASMYIIKSGGALVFSESSGKLVCDYAH